MKIIDIWSMKGFSIKERILRTRDSIAMSVAKRVPLRIRYWITINALAAASIDSKNVPATPLDEVLKNLESPKVVR